MIDFGTPKRLLKKRIQYRINILQERKFSKQFKSLEDLEINVGDFKKHLDDKVFLDFTNIEVEKQLMIFCSG